ncbi:MAG: hypothetical protein ABJ310_00840, partial [Roseobacter sp.]
PLSGAAVDSVTQICGEWPLHHKEQVLGDFPGYPRPRYGTSIIYVSKVWIFSILPKLCARQS